jgi:pimeloyl-ACP methyl ester carboxylesterase
LAATADWQAFRFDTGHFSLTGYAPAHFSPDEALTIYLEGDGLAWIGRSLPSADPTPLDPLALRLALAQPAGNAAYLARPCQYADAEGTGCAQRYWTGERFAPETVAAMNDAVTALKTQFGAQRLTLVGYSGGGNIAALLAARRHDVVRLVTVAGNLDHRAWSAHHRVRELSGSLNASDVAERLSALPQIHFVGGRDQVITPVLAEQWPPALLGQQKRNLHVLPDADHGCCWADRWPALWRAHLETH